MSYDEAVHDINEFKPDLVFLDIVLDRGTSFDLLSELDSQQFHIIFVSAYDEYAVKAFKYNTVDYLLKPVVIDDLVEVTKKVIEQHKKNNFLKEEQIRGLSNTILGNHPKNYITIVGVDRVDFIHPEEIIYLTSSGRYTEFHLTNKKRKVVSSQSLGDYENALDKTLFYRVHNSHLVNLTHLLKINKRAGNYCEMTNGVLLPISRRRFEGLMKYLKGD